VTIVLCFVISFFWVYLNLFIFGVVATKAFEGRLLATCLWDMGGQESFKQQMPIS
jgi:hypothetical protein